MKIEYIFTVFALIGILDKITGNHFKLGDEFEKGIKNSGTLILAMSGVFVLSPVMSVGLAYIFRPLLLPLGIDLSLVGAFFPVDAGGATMAYDLSENVNLRGYNGIIVASMFGATICPVTPLALKMVSKENRGDILTGLLCGFAAIPLGCVVSGLIIGLSIKQILLNTLPIIILSCIICFGLVKKPELIKKILSWMGDLLSGIILVGLGAGIFQKLTGRIIIPGTDDIDNSFMVIGNTAIILSGTFPLLYIISKLLKKPFDKLGEKLKINSVAVLGIITNLANPVPVFSMMDEMNQKGRVMTMAFAVSAACTFGDHLAFVLAFDDKFALPMIVGKLTSGILALVLTNIFYNNTKK